MKEINLKLETKKVECETISIKTAILSLIENITSLMKKKN